MSVKAVAVYTEDKYLFQKIHLELLEHDPEISVMLGEGAEAADLTIIDIDTAAPAKGGKAITMARGNRHADLQIPFAIGSIVRLLSRKKDEPILSLDEALRCAYLRGEKIKLTALEFSLLSYLMKKGGEYSPREELLREVFMPGSDRGIINVYIHYLREKLEAGGEKIILSSRGGGYKIEEKFLQGGFYAQNT
jgi:hypothetical protein